MILRIVFFLVIAASIQSLSAQIGAKIKEQNSIYGIWQNNDFRTQMTLILNQNGTGDFGGNELSYKVEEDKLILTQGGKAITYSFNLQSNSLQLSDGDLAAPVSFSRNTDKLQSNIPDGSGKNTENNNNSNLKEIKIGDQIWSAENLDVSTFRNGDPIPQAKSLEEWKHADDYKKPYWCYYNDDPQNEKKYGKLYNWFAVNDLRGLSPSGWHMASTSEWLELIEKQGGEILAGKKLKNNTGWFNYEDKNFNGNNSNESGFSALPGGFTNEYGNSSGLGFSGW